MDHVIWLFLFRAFLVLSVLFTVLTVTMSIRYRLFSLIRSAAEVRRSNKGNGSRSVPGSVVNNDSVNISADDTPYFAEIADVESKSEDHCDYENEGNSTIVLENESLTEGTDMLSDGSTVILSGGSDSRTDTYIITREIIITYGDTRQIKKYR